MLTHFDTQILNLHEIIICQKVTLLLSLAYVCTGTCMFKDVTMFIISSNTSIGKPNLVLGQLLSALTIIN